MASNSIFYSLIFPLAVTTTACSKPDANPTKPAVSAAASTAASSSAAPRGPADLSDSLAATAHTFELPAMAALVIKNDQVVASGVTGVRKLGDPTPATLDDVWELGACAKSLTATIAAMLVDEGKLSFDDPLTKLFPGITVHPSFAKATLDAVLQHHGGFDRDPPKLLLDRAVAAKDATAARSALARALLAQPAAHPPGTYSYSNAGYLVVAAALEHATGKPYEVLVRERIFAKLGMSSCTFGSPTAAEHGSSPSVPWGHAFKEGHLAPSNPDNEPRLAPVLAPTSAVACSLGDWAKFLRTHMRVPEGAETIASRASLARLHTPAFDKRTIAGFYLEPTEWSGGGALRQFGSSGTYYAEAWLAPAKGLLFLVATNADTANTNEAVQKTFAPLFARYSK